MAILRQFQLSRQFQIVSNKRKSCVMKKSLVIAAAVVMLAGCATDPFTGEQKVSNTAIGAGTGAALGALGGLIIGKATGAKTRTAVLVGAGIGALAGAGIGQYQDKQEAHLRERLRDTGVSITRRGEVIVLNMPSNITFGTEEDRVRREFLPVLNSVALVLKEYRQTLVNVYGHTDNAGRDDFNQKLSERRAVNVAEYLVRQGTDSRRYHVVGFGEERPIASNRTRDGKAQNRRVEIEIVPLKQG